VPKNRFGTLRLEIRQFGDVTFSDEEKALLKQYYISIMSHGFVNGVGLNRDVQEIVTRRF
jgi:hypothetical protein